MSTNVRKMVQVVAAGGETGWLTRRQVAALTGFAPKTLENWAQMDPPKGPYCFRVSNRYRYPVTDFREWQEQQQQQRVAA